MAPLEIEHRSPLFEKTWILSGWVTFCDRTDYRALSPLIHSHFNPYGTFLLDLAKRLMINKEDFEYAGKTSNTSQRKSQAIA